MFPFDTPYNFLLYWSLLCCILPWLYSYFNEHHRHRTMPVNEAILRSWDRIINQPSIKFRNIVVGINCNVDVVLSGLAIINHLNATTSVGNKEILNDFNDLYTTFTHFFSLGAPAERFMADYNMFNKLVSFVETKNIRTQHYIGGNAALIAQNIANTFPAATVFLVGPIGPRSQALLHPSIGRNNSTRISQDELHLIFEYKQGEILGEYVAPASSRFITSHDRYSGSSIVIEMFFNAISQIKPNLIIFSGLHLLEAQTKELRDEKMRLIKRSLLQISLSMPIHFQLGNIADKSHALNILTKIIPYVDSLSINDQELALLANVGNGPSTKQYPHGAQIHAYKIVDMLYWLLTTYGHNKTNTESPNYNYRLQRIHFYCLTYHIIVSQGTDWSNLASGLAAGAKIAGRHSCNINSNENDLYEIRLIDKISLDKTIDKFYNFDPHNPIASWVRNNVVFIYTPVFVCKYPQRTVGIEDSIVSTALLYSQFYKLGY